MSVYCVIPLYGKGYSMIGVSFLFLFIRSPECKTRTYFMPTNPGKLMHRLCTDNVYLIPQRIK